MDDSFKNLIMVIIMIGALMSGTMMFLSGFLVSNGAALPSSVNATLTGEASTLNGVSASIGSQISNSSSSAQTLLGGGQSPNILSSIAATFAVFGGVIVAVFGFIVSLPMAFLQVFALFANPIIDPFSGIASIMIVIALSLIGIDILWAIIKAITKVEP